MGKISPVSSKYICHAIINIEGVVDRPDVIGAIFGQTEGLLGSELELRELQRSGRIGRIEVIVDTKGGKTDGTIIIPSSLDKVETSIVAAALEIIQRIGPCNAKIKINQIEDVRISKRNFVIERAKELLKLMTETTLPDSQELADEVAHSVRVMEITEYGKDRLPAGPSIDDSDEVIVVEGRADVINLLKHGFKNAIAMNGTSVPQTIIDLSKKTEILAFVDGDRGGDLIIKELMQVADIDFITKAPDGKEVEELAKKEIHKAMRGRTSIEQARMDSTVSGSDSRTSSRVTTKPIATRQNDRVQQRPVMQRPTQQRDNPRFARRPTPSPQPKQATLSAIEKTSFRSMLEDLIGTRGAYVLDDKLNILGKVPVSELSSTVKSLNSGIYAIVFDGSIDKEISKTAEYVKVKYLVAMDSSITQQETQLKIVTINDL